MAEFLFAWCLRPRRWAWPRGLCLVLSVLHVSERGTSGLGGRERLDANESLRRGLADAVVQSSLHQGRTLYKRPVLEPPSMIAVGIRLTSGR